MVTHIALRERSKTGSIRCNLWISIVEAGESAGNLAPVMARRYGHKLSFKTPRLQRALKTTRALMDKYGAGYIFVYRYPKGMRTIGALPVGLTDIQWFRFTCLNAASAGVWATLLVGSGYLFGAQLADVMENGWSLFSVVLLAAFCIAGWLMIRRLRATANPA